MEVSKLLSNSLTGALIIGSWLSTIGGVRRWLLLDFTASLLVGVSLLIRPHLLLSVQTTVTLDDVSLYMGRVVGLVLIGNSYNAHLGIYTRSVVERIAIIRSRFISSVLIFAAALYAHVHYHEWNAQHVRITIVGTLVWVMIHGFYGFRSCTRLPLVDRTTDLFLMIDHTVTLFVGMLWFAFPQWLLRNQATIRPNAVSVHIGRILGALLVSSSILVESSTRFPTVQGRNNVLQSRMLVAGVLLLLVVHAQLTVQLRGLHLFVGVATAGLWAANALLGYMALNFIRVPMHRSKAMSNGSSQLQNAAKRCGEGFTVSHSPIRLKPPYHRASKRMKNASIFAFDDEYCKPLPGPLTLRSTC